MPFQFVIKTLMYANRVVMPHVLQKRILKEFHMGYPGICRKMDQDIEKMIWEFKGYQLAAPPIKTQPWPKKDIIWTCIHIDYAGPLKGYYYLVIVDSFSKWPEIYRCKHPTARNAIKVLDEIFSCFGVPSTVVSDNRIMFTGKEFKDYCHSLVNEHMTPTYNPRSNGQAEMSIRLKESKNH